MASGFRSRPPTFSPGMNLSDYYKVEALIRLAEGRYFYLVNDTAKTCEGCHDAANSPSFDYASYRARVSCVAVKNQ